MPTLDTLDDGEDPYLQPARLFNLKAGIPENENRADEYVDRSDVIAEEVIELFDEVTYHVIATERDLPPNEDMIAEELADVLFTVMSFADAMDIDIGEAYRRKAQYNLQKSGDQVVDGKVQDDADVEKPDFDDLVGGGA